MIDSLKSLNYWTISQEYMYTVLNLYFTVYKQGFLIEIDWLRINEFQYGYLQNFNTHNISYDKWLIYRNKLKDKSEFN